MRHIPDKCQGAGLQVKHVAYQYSNYSSRMNNEINLCTANHNKRIQNNRKANSRVIHMLICMHVKRDAAKLANYESAEASGLRACRDSSFASKQLSKQSILSTVRLLAAKQTEYTK